MWLEWISNPKYANPNLTRQNTCPHIHVHAGVLKVVVDARLSVFLRRHCVAAASRSGVGAGVELRVSSGEQEQERESE